MKHIHTLFLAVILAILALFPAPLTGCAAIQKGASEVTPILTKIVDASQYLDAAWSAFCLFKPSICQQYGGEYQKARGILAASLLAARDTTDAVASGGKIEAVRAAYKSIEDLLLKLGIIVPQGTLAAARSDGWTPWEAPRI